jgi:hypothetical protein
MDRGRLLLHQSMMLVLERVLGWVMVTLLELVLRLDFPLDELGDLWRGVR